jgi:predicted transcriptional regulator
MSASAASVTLDDDVEQALRRLAERSGRAIGALANAALRDYVRYEDQVGASVDRGMADLEDGHTRTTEEVRAFLRAQRDARAGR